MLDYYLLKKVTYTKCNFKDDNGEWEYYYKGVVSPSYVKRFFKTAYDIECEVRTEVRRMTLEDFIKNSYMINN